MTAWHTLLDQLIEREKLSRSQVADRSEVSAKTITSWLRGNVKSPRDWRPLGRVLLALRASTQEANEILAGAGHPPVHQLAEQSDTAADLHILTLWLRPDVPFMPPDRLIAVPIGREAELAQAHTALTRHKRYVLFGMGGVGKTTLAIELAHQLRHEYPDGVFWGDLRIATADAVLESWGQVHGIAMERLTDFPSRAARMRAVFSRKKALIILDDVLDSQIALQMVPAQHTECAVLITTRSEVVAQAVARRQGDVGQQLEPFKRPHSLALLLQIVAPDRREGMQEAADTVADLLGDLPLALNICASLCADTGLNLTDMVTLLTEMQTRLDYLRLDEQPLVRIAFEQSWLRLEEAAQQALATLAVFGGRPFQVAAFAASMGVTEPEAKLLLSRLIHRSLLRPVKTTRDGGGNLYQQHTLIASFSTEKLADTDRAWHRFCAYFHMLSGDTAWWRGASAEGWGNMMAGLTAAHRLQDWPLLLSYATNLTEAWRRSGLYAQAREGYALALEAAEALDDTQAKAQILLDWGNACLEQADYGPARRYLMESLTLFSELDYLKGVADAHFYLAYVELKSGAYEAAEQTIQEAYRYYQQEEDVRGIGRALQCLASVALSRGQFERAAEWSVDAVRIKQEIGDTHGLLRSYIMATTSFLQLDLFDQAGQYCRAAERLLNQIEDKAETAAFYHVYADLLRLQGVYAEAEQYAFKTLAMFREMGDRNSEVNALNLLAGIEIRWNDAEPERGRYEPGLGYCVEGLRLCDEMGYQLGKGFLLLMKGRLLAQKGETAEACAAWEAGRVIAQALGNGWLERRLSGLIADQG